MSQKRNLIIGAAILACGVIYLILSAQVPVPGGEHFGVVDSRFFPYILGVLMCILGLGQMAVTWVGGTKVDEQAPRTDYSSLLASAGLMAVYAAFLEPLGFVITSAVFLFAEFWLLTPPDRKRNPTLYTTLAIILPLVVYLVFRYGFDMLLPVGPLTMLG